MLSKPAVVAAALLIGTILVMGVAAAQETFLGGKVRTGNQIVISAGETVSGNLYVFAGDVIVRGVVDGDLVAVGGRVQVAGEVTGDVLAAAGDVTLPGEIGGDSRTSSGQLTISGSIGGDALAAAGSARITRSGTIEQDLIFAAGQMTMSGDVEGSVLGGAGEYTRRGFVGGTEDVGVPEEPSTADRLVGLVSRYVSVLAIAAVTFWLIPRLVDLSVDRGSERWAASFGFGVLGIIGSVIFFVASLLTGVILTILLGLMRLGMLIGTLWFSLIVLWTLLAFALFLVFAFAVPILAGTLLGRLILRSEGEPSWVQRFGLLALGLVGVIVATSVPYAGPVVSLLLAPWAFGAIILSVRNFGAKPTGSNISAESA